MQKQPYNGPLERLDPYCVRIPKSYKSGMRVPGLIFANDKLLEQVKKDQAPDQVAHPSIATDAQSNGSVKDLRLTAKTTTITAKSAGMALAVCLDRDGQALPELDSPASSYDLL